MMFSMKIFVFFAVFSLGFELCFSKCNQSDYEMGGGCCAKCKAGTHVQKHCSEKNTTSCAPCPESTYTAEPNGLLQCTGCSVCDPALGLRVNKTCTQSSDTVCEPQEGHYCTDYRSGGCIQAAEHTKCSPGEYIKYPGTAAEDNYCEECIDGFYSDGTFRSCKLLSGCEALGLTEIKPGTHQSDAECRISGGAIAGITVGVLVVLGVVVLILCCKKECKTVQPTVRGQEPTQVRWIRHVAMRVNIVKVGDDASPSSEKC